MGIIFRIQGCADSSWDSRLIDLQKASESKDYCDEIKGIVNSNNIEITELSTHLQGQLVAVHPAYDIAFDGFAAAEVKGNPKARQEWAVKQVMMAAQASNNLGLDRHATFSGALAWPYFYPWPQRPQGLVENAFDELAKDGSQYLIVLMKMVSTFVMKFIQVKIFMTV